MQKKDRKVFFLLPEYGNIWTAREKLFMEIPWEKLRKTGLALFCAAAAFGSVHSYLDGAALDEVPVLYEEAPAIAVLADDPGRAEPKDSRIDINTASEEELCTLKGIGPTKAAAIVAYRQSYGGFVCIEEIMEVKGIGEGTFEKIREFIYIGDEGGDL